MGGTVSLPYWLAAVLFLLAAWAVIERFLVPGARWFVRRKVGRVIEEIGKRLRIEVHPFALTRRQVLIDRLMYDPRVMDAAGRHAAETGVPRPVAMAEIERYAREIVPAFNAYAYFRLGYWIARKVATVLYRVRVGFSDDPGFAAIEPRSSVVFVMNHRSNMDYILVAYLAASRTALSYAVGEWARVWPLQALVRSLGAYFIRRESRNPLYRLVLGRYVAMATEAGVVQAIFPEGGLTRDGALRPPKLGLLDYMVRSFHAAVERDIVFIPVGINYDRTFEDRSQILSLDHEAPRKGAGGAALTALGFLLRHLALMARGRWFRFGYACVNFGSPLSMRRYCRRREIDFRTLGREERFREVEALAGALMDEVGKVIPVLPVSLVSTALLNLRGRSAGMLELKAEAHRLILRLQEGGTYVHIPRRDQDYAVTVGLRMLTLRRIVDEKDGLFEIRPGETPMIEYYANAIRHLIPSAPSIPRPSPSGDSPRGTAAGP